MQLHELFRQACEDNLQLNRNIVNPSNKNPKKVYSDLYFNGLKSYKNIIKGGHNAAGKLCLHTQRSSKAGFLTGSVAQMVESSWIVKTEGENLKPLLTDEVLILIIGTLVWDLRNPGGVLNLSLQAREVLLEWLAFLEFVETSAKKTDRVSIAALIGHAKSLDEKIENWLIADNIGKEEVLNVFEDEQFSDNKVISEYISKVLSSAELSEILNKEDVSDLIEEAEEARLELVTHMAASMMQHLLLLGPPGTGKTYLVQRSIDNIPIVQVSLEGSTEPETVVANIAQTPDGKFKAFLAETAKALKLGMLLAIVESLRKGKRIARKKTDDSGVWIDDFDSIPKNSRLGDLLPGNGNKSKISDDLLLILDSISDSFAQEERLKCWLAVLDAYADPFDLERWEEILFIYHELEAFGVGTTCVLNIEEIYHAVENRKILDLLINLMAGQKKLPLSKAGVVGGELYGHNVVVFATGNPITDCYLPAALESRFTIKEFLGYPDEEEEKRRMAAVVANYFNPPPPNRNLLSTRLEDYGGSSPLPKKNLEKISEDLREKIYSLVQWTRSMYSNQDLRAPACPRMAMMWELLTSAFLAEGKTEKEAFLLSVKSTVTALVSIDFQGEPDPEGLKNIFQQAESYFLN